MDIWLLGPDVHGGRCIWIEHSTRSDLGKELHLGSDSI